MINFTFNIKQIIFCCISASTKNKVSSFANSSFESKLGFDNIMIRSLKGDLKSEFYETNSETKAIHSCFEITQV